MTRTDRARINLATLVQQRRRALHLSRPAMLEASNGTLTRAVLLSIDRAEEPPALATLIELDRVLWWNDGTSTSILDGTATTAPVDANDLPAARRAPSGPDRARIARTGRAVQDRRRALRIKEVDVQFGTGFSSRDIQAFENGQSVNPDTLDAYDDLLEWERGTARSVWNGGTIPDVRASFPEETDGDDDGDVAATELAVNLHPSWPTPQRLREVAATVAPDIAAVLEAVADSLDASGE